MIIMLLQIPTGMSHANPIPAERTAVHLTPHIAPPTLTWLGNLSIGSADYSAYDPNTHSVWITVGSTTTAYVINNSKSVYDAQVANPDGSLGICPDSPQHAMWTTSTTGTVGDFVLVNDTTFATIAATGSASTYVGGGCVASPGGSTMYGDAGGYLTHCAYTTSITCGNYAVSGSQLGVGYDSYLSQALYVTGSSSDTLVVEPESISSSTFGTGGSWQVCYSPATNYVYVPDGASVYVFSVTSTTVTLAATMAVGGGDKSCAVDSEGIVWIDGASSNTVTGVYGLSVVTTIDGITAPWSISYDPYHGYLVVGTDATTPEATVIGLSPTVTIAETGLPTGRTWDAVVNSTSGQSSTATVSFTESINAGKLTWSASPVAPPSNCIGTGCAWWVASPANGTVTVGTSSVTVNVHYTWGSWITVTETGLPERVLGCLPSGCSYLTDVPWWWNSTSCPGTCGTADESLSWSALAQNGTYVFTAASVGNWSAVPPPTLVYVVTVSAPYPVSVGVQFVWTTNLTFHETGLSKGTSWSVTLHYKSPGVTCPHPSIWCGVTNETLSSAVANVSFGHGFVANGLVTANVNGTDYTYTVNSPKGYTALPGTGNITLPDPVQITFLANATNSTNSTNGTGGGGGGSGGGGGGGGASSSGPQNLLQSLVSHGDWIWVIFVASVIVLALLFVLLDGSSRGKRNGGSGGRR
jgi:uncharacterized membrane protein YgcG